MIISLIVAIDEKNGIGLDGKLPWRLKADLQSFKQITWGHTLLIGRKTYESIGKALPGRRMLILTHQSSYQPSHCPVESCRVIHSLDEGLSVALAAGETELFVAGGAQVYAQSIGYAHRIYLTRVHTSSPSDVAFPPLDLADWRLLESKSHPADADNQFAFTFEIYDRSSADV